VRWRERERESFRVRVWEREHHVGSENASCRLEKCVVSVRKMRRIGPSRDDVNSARRIRLRPSCDVKIRYRGAQLRREVSKRW
jgi:hypothetical protein